MVYTVLSDSFSLYKYYHNCGYEVMYSDYIIRHFKEKFDMIEHCQLI